MNLSFCHFKKFLFFLFLGFFLNLIYFSPTKAVRVAITPLVFELTGEKGGMAESEVRVMNPSYDETITVKMESEDIFPEGEEGRIRLEVPPTERIPFSLSSWISFEPGRLTLGPREEKPVKFTIKVPENSEPGGHYAAVIAKIETVGLGGGVAVGVVPRVASLVLLTVPGPMEEKLSVIEFITEKNYYEFGPVKFLLRIENSGTVHVKPTARLTVNNIFGQKVGEVSFETRTILPNSIRKLETELPKKWLWAGKYTATLTGTYGPNNIPLEIKTITFWAFPWKVGIVLLMIIVFFFLTRRRWIKAIKILIKGEGAIRK